MPFHGQGAQTSSPLNGTQSARAAFEQKVFDRNGKLVQETKGNFVFQRPGRFRWVYDKPADQVIVATRSFAARNAAWAIRLRAGIMRRLRKSCSTCRS